MPKKNIPKKMHRKASATQKRAAKRPDPRSAGPAAQGPWRARRQHFSQTGDIVRIEHSEIIGPVLSSTVDSAYAVDVYSLNPASSTFPWLQQASKIYDQYRLRRLRLSFVSSANTTRDGTVALGVDFDATDAAPGSVTDLARLRDAAAGQIHQPLDVHVSCGQQAANWYYTAEAPATTDRLSDVGLIFAATQGITTTGSAFSAGFLEVHYVYEFRMPELLTLDVARPAEFTAVIERGTMSHADIFASDGVTGVQDTSAVNGSFAAIVDDTTRRTPALSDSLLRLAPGLWRVTINYLKAAAFAGWAVTDDHHLLPRFIDSLTDTLISPVTSVLESHGKVLNTAGTLAVGYYYEFYVTLERLTYMYANFMIGLASSAVGSGSTVVHVVKAETPTLGPQAVSLVGRHEDNHAPQHLKEIARANEKSKYLA